MEHFAAIPTVYSYYPPEVRRIVRDLFATDFPNDVLLSSVASASTPYKDRVRHTGLDDFHQPIIDKVIAFYRDRAHGLESFSFRYPTMGSEEAIREFMTLLALQGVKFIYVLRGDYEGYREVAKTRGMETVEVSLREDPAHLPRGYWFISNPSARDGDFLPDGTIYDICQAGHKVFYDLAYMGATPQWSIDVFHPNIVAVAHSFSKPYGLFYWRIGFLFVREEVPALFANKWFKSVPGLLIAERIAESFDLEAYTRKYKRAQQEIINGAIKRDLGLSLYPSDAFLLARFPIDSEHNLTPAQQNALKKFKRADTYRFCLTPYFLDYEMHAA